VIGFADSCVDCLGDSCFCEDFSFFGDSLTLVSCEEESSSESFGDDEISWDCFWEDFLSKFAVSCDFWISCDKLAFGLGFGASLITGGNT
jgi:hypothetical protein